MRIRNLIIIVTGWSIFSSPPILAHVHDSGPGVIGILLHPFTGIDHLLLLFLAVICIVCLVRWQQRNM